MVNQGRNLSFNVSYLSSPWHPAGILFVIYGSIFYLKPHPGVKVNIALFIDIIFCNAKFDDRFFFPLFDRRSWTYSIMMHNSIFKIKLLQQHIESWEPHLLNRFHHRQKWSCLKSRRVQAHYWSVYNRTTDHQSYIQFQVWIVLINGYVFSFQCLAISK